VPEKWQEEIRKDAAAAPPAAETDIDYAALIRAVESMDESQFGSVDLDTMVQQYSRTPAGRS
jgi:hypothetical protein